MPKQILTEELTDIVKELRKSGKKIVFTNGCFDILHTGHIFLLNNARKAGDILIVGVNSDASIRKIKGSVHLIKSLHPYVFVKGGNYTEDSIPEAALLKKLGCAIKIIPYQEEHSTTHIIDKILDTKHETGVEL